MALRLPLLASSLLSAIDQLALLASNDSNHAGELNLVRGQFEGSYTALTEGIQDWGWEFSLAHASEIVVTAFRSKWWPRYWEVSCRRISHVCLVPDKPSPRARGSDTCDDGEHVVAEIGI